MLGERSSRVVIARAVRLVLAAIVMAMIVTSCDAGSGNSDGGVTSSLSCPVVGTAPITVLVGARSNSYVPELPQGLAQVLTSAASSGQQVTLIRVDGRPEPFFAERFEYVANNGPARQDELNFFLDTISSEFREGAVAQVSEVDVLSALSLASRATSPGGTIFVLDSGLQTVQPLDFRQDGLLLADPVDIVTYLSNFSLLPDLTGTNVAFVGIGNTALPQEGLDNRLRGNLRGIWRAIGEASGACVDMVEVGSPQVSVEDAPPVSVVPLPLPPPPPAQNACGDTVLDERNNVGFLPDTATFRDEVAARMQIGLIVDQVRDGGQRIELVGTTARSGTPEGQVRLSEERAQRVRDIMIELGVSGDRISVVGAGAYSDEFYIPDGGPEALNPAQAVLNRRVVVRLTCP